MNYDWIRNKTDLPKDEKYSSFSLFLWRIKFCECKRSHTHQTSKQTDRQPQGTGTKWATMYLHTPHWLYGYKHINKADEKVKKNRYKKEKYFRSNQVLLKRMVAWWIFACYLYILCSALCSIPLFYFILSFYFYFCISPRFGWAVFFVYDPKAKAEQRNSFLMY